MKWFRLEQMRSGEDRAHGRRFAALRAAAVVAALLLLVVLVVGRPAAAAPQATIVRCDPATVAGPLGTQIDIDIYVENVVELYGADVRLGFDPAKLQVVDADPGTDGIQIMPLDTFLSPDFVVREGLGYAEDPDVIWYAVTQVNPSEAVSGSGPLARVTFTALEAGSFTLPITYHKLARRDSLEIPSTAQGCSVTFFNIDEGGVTFVPFTARD
jgi:hypothetical protein